MRHPSWLDGRPLARVCLVCVFVCVCVCVSYAVPKCVVCSCSLRTKEADERKAWLAEDEAREEEERKKEVRRVSIRADEEQNNCEMDRVDKYPCLGQLYGSGLWRMLGSAYTHPHTAPCNGRPWPGNWYLTSVRLVVRNDKPLALAGC